MVPVVGARFEVGCTREGKIARWPEIQATGPSSRVIPFSFMFYLSFPFRFFFQIHKV